MSTKHTPLMQQYHEIKEQYPSTIIFFQVGDFYELFFEDAKIAADVLAIALTSRGFDADKNPIPLCGVPVHALQHYLAKLVKAGFHVAICDQLESPQPGKMVKRGVVQVLTPGTLTDSALLDDKHASYLFSFFPMHSGMGLLFGELLTAQLHATILPVDGHKSLEAELTRFLPDEILVPTTKEGAQFSRYFSKQGFATTGAQYFENDQSAVLDWLKQQFTQNVHEVVTGNQPLLHAVHNFFGYLKKNQESSLTQFKQLHLYQPDDFLQLDTSTQKNLELIKNLHDGSRNATLFSLLDKATTSMGSRAIAKWIMRPLVNQEMIEGRQESVRALLDNVSGSQKIKQILQAIGDVERVIGRIALARGSLHDYQAVKRLLCLVPALKEQLNSFGSSLLTLINQQFGDFSSLLQFLEAALNDDQSHDWLIKKGFNKRLDELRAMVHNSRSLVLDLEKKEQEATGINSLKIRYTNAQGYFIEITKSNLHLVPERLQRTQTLVGKERYTTEALKKLQADILTASTQIDVVERELFDSVKREVSLYSGPLRKAAHALAHLDALLSLRNVAYEFGYVCPTFNNENSILIKEGRHPVIEQVMGTGFIPNDTMLHDDHSLLIITGPNMGGKSTFLRQTALITIMAQIGSFVPAASANIAIRDRVFTRIGASDNVAAGKSTFLVEMEETASICRYATKKSLIILDEVGRGTSTYDGLALAQAVVEYIATSVQARCLFATHYHELTELGKRYATIVPFYAASKKNEKGIVFLHKIIEGVADGSFGLEVAKLADLPESIVARAEELLTELHDHHGKPSTFIPAQRAESGSLSDNAEILLSAKKEFEAKVTQLEKELAVKEELLKEIRALRLDDLSPKKAFDFLWKLHSSL